jgi:hypothetical protein
MPGTDSNWGIFVVGTGYENGMNDDHHGSACRRELKNEFITYCKELPVLLKNRSLASVPLSSGIRFPLLSLLLGPSKRALL